MNLHIAYNSPFITQALNAIFALLIVLTPKLDSEVKQPQTVLAKHEISLAKRYNDPWVNSVFRDNILLNMAYMKGQVKKGVEWEETRKPFTYSFTLKPGEVFAFHEDVLSEYEGKVVKTSQAHFNGAEGFKSDGYLMGDGVCHLASLINMTAQKAGLDTHAPTNHNFAVINEVPREYGASIYYYPGRKTNNARQNVYVVNNKTQEIAFNFTYQNDKLSLAITSIN